MAAFAQKIKIKKLKKLGIAHEKGNYRQFKKYQNEEGERPDSLSNVMDLKNNDLGLKIGSENKKISLADLKELVINEIKNGTQKLRFNEYKTCFAVLINKRQTLIAIFHCLEIDVLGNPIWLKGTSNLSQNGFSLNVHSLSNKKI